MNRHYIVTNREIINEDTPDEYINVDGSEEARDELRFGYYEFNDLNDEGKVTLYPDQDTENISFSDPATLPTNDAAFGSTRMFADLYLSMKQDEVNNDAMVFVHGFNCDLTEALKTVRILHEKYVGPDSSPINNIILFTWPAMGKILEYRSDARDAVTSGYALARGMLKLEDFFVKLFGMDARNPDHPVCNRKIHLLSHSMGNRVVESMMEELIATKSNLSTIFDQIILAAADIDNDAMESPNPLYDLIEICKRVYIYFDLNDEALMISETTKNAFKRLGKFGPKNSKLLPDHVKTANVTSIRDEPGIENQVVNHWYYYASLSAVGDITDVLKGNDTRFPS